VNAKKRLLLAFAAAGVACSLSALAEPLTMQWTVDGVPREALVFPPSATAAAAKAPLVFAFHGHGGTMRTAAGAMAIQTAWPEALVVYMQGLPTVSPNDQQGRYPGWQHQVGESGDRDLKFFDAALASLRERFPVDDHRVYSTGFSNGGSFSYILWGTRGSVFAAFASCAGSLAKPPFRLTVPKPLLHIGGQADKVVAFEDQLQTIETARLLDGSSGKGEACGADCTSYPSSKGAPVVTVIHSGGHVYPPWASAKIVEFFKDRALKP